MKIFSLTTFIILGMVFISSAQIVHELDKRNGFQDIKMATDISQYEGLEYKKNVNHALFPETSLYVAKKGSYENIGNLKIYDLEVLAYRDSIFQVRVVTEKNRMLYKGLKKAFGEPKFSMRSGQSEWIGNNLKLIYDDHSKKKMEMIYYSFVMEDKLKSDKQEAVEEMADEF